MQRELHTLCAARERKLKLLSYACIAAAEMSCRETWARVNVDNFRYMAMQTFNDADATRITPAWAHTGRPRPTPTWSTACR